LSKGKKGSGGNSSGKEEMTRHERRKHNICAIVARAGGRKKRVARDQLKN
jgi:hypothetical protein